MKTKVELIFKDGRIATFRNVIFFSKGDTIYWIDYVCEDEIGTVSYNIEDVKYFDVEVYHSMQEH